MYAIAKTIFSFTPRMIISFWTNYVGAVFLAMTIEMTEFIRNAVALEVILQVDEMLFKVLLPEQTKIEVHKIFPLPVKRIKGFKTQLAPVLNMDFIAVLMFAVLSTHVGTQVGVM